MECGGSESLECFAHEAFGVGLDEGESFLGNTLLKFIAHSYSRFIGRNYGLGVP
jgi:hypothetical protein